MKSKESGILNMDSELSAVFYPDKEEKYVFADSDLEDIGDDKLKEAYRESERTGVLTPLLKFELKSQINARRHSEGKLEIIVKFEKCRQHPNETESPESLARKAKRREQNRRASKKLRQKTKQLEPSLLMELHTLEATNSEWKAEIAEWMAEKIRLENIVASHECCMLSQEPNQSCSPALNQSFMENSFLNFDELQLPSHS